MLSHYQRLQSHFTNACRSFSLHLLNCSLSLSLSLSLFLSLPLSLSLYRLHPPSCHSTALGSSNSLFSLWSSSSLKYSSQTFNTYFLSVTSFPVLSSFYIIAVFIPLLCHLIKLSTSFRSPRLTFCIVPHPFPSMICRRLS